MALRVLNVLIGTFILAGITSFHGKYYFEFNIKFINIISTSRSNASNCSNQGNISVFGIQSFLSCAVICVLEVQFRCQTFQFTEALGQCDLLACKVINRIGQIESKGFQISECPNGFTYVERHGKCYFLNSSRAAWNETREACNWMRSHPLVIEGPDEEAAISAFLAHTEDYQTGKCSNPFPAFAKYDEIWIGGQFENDSAKKSPFVWKPFDPRFLMIGPQYNVNYWRSDPNNIMKYQNWVSGQPDNYAPPEGCVAVGKGVKMYDASCKALFCVICEIDIY